MLSLCALERDHLGSILFAIGDRRLPHTHAFIDQPICATRAGRHADTIIPARAPLGAHTTLTVTLKTALRDGALLGTCVTPFGELQTRMGRAICAAGKEVRAFVPSAGSFFVADLLLEMAILAKATAVAVTTTHARMLVTWIDGQFTT